jgi:hypothetical protein
VNNVTQITKKSTDLSFFRVDKGRNHWYEDARGKKIPGVTTILSSGLPKPALLPWGIKSVAEYAINHWGELEAKPIAERLTELKNAPYADRDAAANRGTEVHNFGEKLIKGEEVSPPPELIGYVEAYARFLDEWEVEPLLVENAIVNHRVRYAGTFDMVIRIPWFGDDPVIADIKTSRSGVYGETAFQLAAYANAEKYQANGEEFDFPKGIKRGFVIHVRPEGYGFYEVPIKAKQFREFCYIAEVAKAAEDARHYVKKVEI